MTDITNHKFILSLMSTAELVDELSRRDEVEFKDRLKENTKLRIETVYYRSDVIVDTDFIILVVRE